LIAAMKAFTISISLEVIVFPPVGQPTGIRICHVLAPISWTPPLAVSSSAQASRLSHPGRPWISCPAVYRKRIDSVKQPRCAYPGLLWHDDELYLSYYSTHKGKTSIYLTKVKIVK
jgi:hypothetical protein